MTKTMSLGLVAGAALGLNAVAAAQVSQDEVRAIVAESQADASQRTSLLAGADGGHDGDFFLAGEGFRLEVGGALQFRYMANFRDEDAADDDLDTGFQAARTRINFDGTVHDDWGFRVQANFDPDGNFALEDAYGTYDFGDGWSLGWGQFRAPLTREFLVDEIYQLAVERSGVESFFSGGRTQGAWLGWTQEDWRINASFNDGAGAANTDFNSAGESDYGFTGRFEWKSADDWSRFRDFTSEQGQEMAFLLGAGAHYQQMTIGKGSQTNDPTDTDVTSLLYTLDASVEGDGWNAFGAFYGDWRDFNGAAVDDEFTNFGFVVQGGFRFTEMTEVFGRYEHLILDDDLGLDEDNFGFVTLGVNQYYAGHAAKATADVVFSLEDTSPELTSAPLGVLPNTLTGLLGEDDNPEIVIRLQFQLLF